MKEITRKELDRISILLQNHINTDESIKLADRLKNADIIPKLYQFAYVESLHKVLSKCKTLNEFVEKFKYSYSNEQYYLKEDAFEAAQLILYKAHERQNEICDFADSTLPEHSIGRCQEENHYESVESKIDLTGEEQDEFDKIKDEEGYNEACEHFDNKFNPNGQKLTLILNFGDDESKVIKGDGYYVCEDCLDSIAENSEGNIACDLEMAEEIE